MAFRFSYATRFKKNYRKLSTVEQKQVRKKIEILAENPFHPSLRTKRVQGTQEFECSVNMDIRIIWHYEGDTIILLLDIGHHDNVLNRY